MRELWPHGKPVRQTQNRSGSASGSAAWAGQRGETTSGAMEQWCAQGTQGLNRGTMDPVVPSFPWLPRFRGTLSLPRSRGSIQAQWRDR